MKNLICITDCSPLSDPQLYKKAYAAVSEERRLIADRFKQEEDRFLCLGAGLLERHSGLSVRHDESGKPYAVLSDKAGAGAVQDDTAFYVSISHSYPYALLGISKYPIGVDIEKITDRYESILKHFYLDEDREFIAASADPAAAFFELWTRKEAYIKKNAPQDLRQISVARPEEGMEYISYSIPGFACTAYVNNKKGTSFTEVPLISLL